MRIVRVRGGSMEPTLSDGDYIVCIKARGLIPGLIYWVEHPRFGKIVKRLNDEGMFEGDAPDSTPTAKLGSIDDSNVLGRALLAITPTGIRRLRGRRPYSHRA